MLKLTGHINQASLPGNYNLAVAATPTPAFVGGQPLAMNADGNLELALAYNATSNVLGLARYSEATFLRDAAGGKEYSTLQHIKDVNGNVVGAKCSIVRDALGVQIGKGKDPQSQLIDATCPYDTTKTYAEGEPLYVKTTGILTNAAGDAGSNPIAIGKVITPPTSSANGDLMTIHVFGDLR